MPEFIRRVRYLLNRRRFDQELADDMECHREMAGEGSGSFGNTLRLREEAREAWGWMWLDRLAQDLHYAARKLRKSPGFTLAGVTMLAIGIGANVAVFGFFDLLVLRPLPVRDPATLLRFHRRGPQNYAYAVPYPQFAFLSQYTKTLSATLALNITKLTVPGEEKPIDANFVTANFFSELGATAQIGRALDPTRDDAPGAEPVVVLSHGFWQRHFGADPAAVGHTLRLNGKLATVVGVAFDEFSGLSMSKPDLWSPLTQQPYFASGSKLLTDFSADGGGVRMWGRLAAGMTPGAAEQELNALTAQLRDQHPNEIWERETLPSELGGYAKSLIVGDRRGSGAEKSGELIPISSLIGALSLLILAVACANLGSLLLARGVAREREMSIRVAVGAGRNRLVRQLFTESLVLALLGSIAGVFVGFIVLRSILTLTDAPAWMNPLPDARVLVFAAGAGFLSAVLFGLTPAWQLARQRHRANVLRQVLVGAQVAASCVLLIVAGLLVRALNHAISADPGFSYQQVIAIDPALFTHGYSPVQARSYLDAFATRLRALPGVESVALTDTPPLGRRQSVASVTVNGRSVAVHINHVDPGFFQTMRIPLLRGRNLTANDKNMMIISQPMARLFWPGEDAIGKHFTSGPENTVIGISGTERLVAIEDSEGVEAYFPITDDDLPSMVLLVKSVNAPENLVRSAASIARAIDPKLFPEVQLLRTSFKQKLKTAQNSALVVTALGFIAQLLACLGIVGVVAFVISQRTKEIGIRMALGAKPMHVLALVLRHFVWPVAGGLLAGVGCAAALSGLLRGQLYGISHLDPASYLAAVAVFVVTVAIAALVPARRAFLVDPMLALRQD